MVGQESVDKLCTNGDMKGDLRVNGGHGPPPWSVWLTHRDAMYIIPDAPLWLVNIGSLPVLTPFPLCS